MNHNVIHPNHYNQSGRRECWDEMIDMFGVDATIIFDCLNAYKYMYRAGNKDGNSKEQDMAKADNYINHAKSLIRSSDVNYIFAHTYATYKLINDVRAKEV